MTTKTPAIEVTELAARKLGEVLAEQGKTDGMLRVMVTTGPGGGMQYMLGVEDAADEGDVVIETQSVKVLVDADSLPLIEGASIDYVEGLMRSGFVISNPNAPAGGGGGCACGGSGGCGGGGGRRKRNQGESSPAASCSAVMRIGRPCRGRSASRPARPSASNTRAAP